MEDQEIVALYWQRSEDAIRETAAYCGLSETNAKSILFRTRQKLKAYLESEGY